MASRPNEGERVTNSEEPLRKIRDEHEALAILEAAASKACNGTITDWMLYDYLPKVGFAGSVERIRTAMHRLESIGLIQLRSVNDRLIADLTRSGEEFLSGIAPAEGVAKPRRE